MRTARLDEIIRQKDPALKEAVEQLARGEVREAIGNLNSQGRVHEIGDRQERIGEIAREYVRSPEKTLVVSPDNESRREINEPHPSRDAERGQGQRRRAARACALRAAGRDRRGPAARAELREAATCCATRKARKPLGIEAGRICACGARGPRKQHAHGEAARRRRAELRSAPLAGCDGLPRQRAQVRAGRPRAADGPVSRAEAR